MNDLQTRLSSLSNLGKNLLEAVQKPYFSDVCSRASIENKWFSESDFKRAVEAISQQLTIESLEEFQEKYTHLEFPLSNKTVALISAGNIPLVGFQDAFYILVAGFKLQWRPSSNDATMVKWFLEILKDTSPTLWERIILAEKIEDFQAAIATGSNNASRYFEHYFQKIPHIIRKNRTSVGVLHGNESTKDLENFADDIFLYYGLGCRNISLLFLPENYDLNRLAPAFRKYASLLDQDKFYNNFLYRKTILEMNRQQFYHVVPTLMIENCDLNAQLATLHYCTYKNMSEVQDFLKDNDERLQCVASVNEIPKTTVLKPGTLQSPGLLDYADDIDVMEFLKTI